MPVGVIACLPGQGGIHLFLQSRHLRRLLTLLLLHRYQRSWEGKVIATGAGAETKMYTPVAADGGKFLGIEITPASYDTVVGTPVEVGLMPRRTVTPLVVALV